MTNTSDRLGSIKARLEAATKPAESYIAAVEQRISSFPSKADIEWLIAEVERLRDIIDCGCNALTDSINVSGNQASRNIAMARRMRREGLGETAAGVRCDTCGGTGIQRNSLGQASGVGPRCEDCKDSGALYVSRPTAPARGPVHPDDNQ